MLLYYITDRMEFAGDEINRQRRLLEKIAEAARCGIDYIQLREKDLPARELEVLACKAVRTVRENSRRSENHEPGTKILINSRGDIAIAAGADGVHLRSDDISPSGARSAWRCSVDAPAREKIPANPIIGVSCHTSGEVVRAASDRADFAVFGPMFEKKSIPDIHPTGLDILREVCRHKVPVVALGGINLNNARSCVEAGAAGIAAIRLFQKNEISEVVNRLRGRL